MQHQKFLIRALAGSLVILALSSWVCAQTPNFGPNVFIFDPSMPASSINSQLTTLAGNAEFSTNRFAVLFKPGTYNGVTDEVGYYESVAGLGTTPDSVVINGFLTTNQTDGNGNITTNFWRSIENMEIFPSSEPLQWGVSQGSPFRRMDVEGNLELTNTSCGFASGGFISDSKISGQVSSCSQQQWYTRNSTMGSWNGAVWNMVFSGVSGAPAQSFPSPPDTVLSSTPVSREKPFLYIDSSGNWNVFVPALKTNSSGTSWSGGGLGTGTSVPISKFFIAQPSSTAAQINAALSSGQNLILTPGIYKLSGPINVTNANTVVLGLGYATLIPQSGTAAITVADVDGVQIAGLIFDGGPVNSPVLLQVGVPNSTRASHASNPTSLNDMFFRIGGAEAGTATTSLEIDSNNVILDDIWAWRADHGAGVGWTSNTAAQGVVVNGDNVTALGLAVEHYQKLQVTWNGNNGETIFYQSELPYDVPSQSAWMFNSIDGYPSYFVADSVANHVAYGLGVYSFFNQGVPIVEQSAISVPNVSGVSIHDAVSVMLTGSGEIVSIVDNAGTIANVSGRPQYLTLYNCASNCPSGGPAAPSNLTATAASSSQINLSWTASSTSGAFYTVFRSTTAGFTPSSANQIATGLNGTTFSDTGLAASTTYFYAVEADDSSGASSPSNLASATTAGGGGGGCTDSTPAAPANLTAAAASSSQINLSWTASTTSGVAYSVFRSTTSGFTPSSSNQVASGLSAASFSNTALTASTTYFYVVEAVNCAGTASSNQASATTQSSGGGGGSAAVAIDAGSTSAVAPFAADTDFSGGSTINHANTIDLSGVTNPAPAAVYQTARVGNFTYTIPGFAAGSSNTVRLHFAETFWTAAGSRIFNVSINGTQVLANFDVFAAAGAQNKAVVRQFTANANSSGQYVITFTSVKDNSLVSAIEVGSGSTTTTAAVQINSAGPAVSPFAADTDFSGGSTINHANTIDLSGVTNPAPAAVYQTARIGNFTYTIPGFAAGSSNTVRLHFAETFWSTAGSRIFNVSINGTQVLANFDVFAAAGAQNKAVVRQFTANANSSGQYVITFTSVKDNSLLSAIEIGQ